MKLLIDENLSPRLAASCAEKGIYAVAVAHVGLSGSKDTAIWQYAPNNDFVVVTGNTRDFMNLVNVQLHPGVIAVREGSLARDEQWSRLELALDHILKHADPTGYMINRVVEVRSAREIRAQQIPPGERAKNGEPAAMRLAMERILPTGRGRPLPIELPPVNSAADAQVAAGVIMEALKEGALSAREAVDLINVVAALTRLTGALEYIKKVARMEVAKSAQTLGFEHFLAGRPADNDYARRVGEMNAEEKEAETEEDERPGNPNAWPPSEDEGLQIVADSDDGGRRTGVG